MTKLNLAGIRVDPERSTAGRWFDAVEFARTQSLAPLDAPHPTHFCVRVARLNNPAFRERLAELCTERRAELDRKDEGSVRAWREVTLRATSECIAVGWANAPGTDGQPLPYSASLMAETLADPANDLVLQLVDRASSNLAAFLQGAEDAVLGN